MIRYSDFYTGNTLEEVLLEASSINLREEVLELAQDLQQQDRTLTQLNAIERAYKTLKEHYESE